MVRVSSRIGCQDLDSTYRFARGFIRRGFDHLPHLHFHVREIPQILR
jgi:hypothetical protein